MDQAADLPAKAQPPGDANCHVEVFYDGECPLCRREIALLKYLDRHRRIRFTDITASDFRAESVGVSVSALMDQIHGRLPDGTLIQGVEVFRRLYAAVGFSALVAVTRWPGVRQTLDFAYAHFAKHRLKLTGRCTPALCSTERSTHP